MKRLILFAMIMTLLVAACSSDRPSNNASTDPEPYVTRSDQYDKLMADYGWRVDDSTLHVCLEGSMHGEWVRDGVGGQIGQFNGLWIANAHDTAGYYSGEFWTADDGRGLYLGSVSGYVTDEVRAYLFGTWFYDDSSLCPICGSGHGVFHGLWISLVSDQLGIGVMEGEFGWADSPENNHLPMTGDWTWYCLNDAVEVD